VDFFCREDYIGDEVDTSGMYYKECSWCIAVVPGHISTLHVEESSYYCVAFRHWNDWIQMTFENYGTDFLVYCEWLLLLKSNAVCSMSTLNPFQVNLDFIHLRSLNEYYVYGAYLIRQTCELACKAVFLPHDAYA